MTDLQQAARTVVAAALIAGVVKADGDTAKAAVDTQMAAAGIERLRVTADDGTDVGTLTRAARKPKATVVDEGAFTKWVAARYPTEVVPAVRAAFRDRLLAEATAAGDPIDSGTGEVIPGVELATGDPYVSCRPTAEARERMRVMLAASGLLALTDGGRS